MAEDRNAVHDRVAAHIAGTRFPFPDQSDWPADYRTVVNAGDPQAAIKFRDHFLYPDIVVIDGRGIVREIGEVVLEIRPEIVPRLTMAAQSVPVIPESGARHFFLYVPVEQSERAIEFLRNYRISYAGLRTFEIAGDDIRITPVDTPGHAKDHRNT